MTKPGNEPDVLMAILSPRFKPASLKYLIIAAAKYGLRTLLFAPTSPGVDVSSVNSGPRSAVLFKSSSSISMPRERISSFKYFSASSIKRTASFCSLSKSSAFFVADKTTTNTPKRAITTKRIANVGLIKSLFFIL